MPIEPGAGVDRARRAAGVVVTTPFLDRSTFRGASSTIRDATRVFAGEASFDGGIAFTNWPRVDVARLLPAGLELAVNTSSAPAVHPVVFVFGAHTWTSVILAGATLPIGTGYGEFAVVVPFVTHAPDAVLHSYVARMCSGYFPAVVDGNSRYGFSKDVAKMSWHGPMFVMTTESGQLLLHAALEASSPWQATDHGLLPSFAAMQEIFTLPMVGRTAEGRWVCSWFGWDFGGAEVRATRCWVSIDGPLLPAVAPPQSHTAVCAFEVRRMLWKLSWPEPCRF